MRYAALALLLICLAVTAGSQDEAADDPGRQAFDAGVEAYNAGDHEGALAKFLEALESYEGKEGEATILTWLGTTCYELRQWDEAIDYLTRATTEDPMYEVAFNNLGNAYLEKGNPLLKDAATAAEGKGLLQKAIEAYEQAIALKSVYFYPVFNLALTYATLQEWDKTWNTYHKAITLKEAAYQESGKAEDRKDLADVWRSFGRALKVAGEYEKAIERYGRAAELDATCVECSVQLGWLYSKQARWPEAEGAYRSAVGLEPANFDAQLGLGIALYSQRKCGEAREPLQTATDLRADSFEAFYNLGLVEDCLSDAPAAERAYASAAALNSGDAPCLNNLGVAIYTQDRACDAVEQFRAAIAADDSYVMAHINLALAMETCGQDDAATLKQWEATVEKFPRQASAHCGLANALYRKGEVNRALAEYLRCLELDERNVEAHNNVGLIYLDREQNNEAVAHFRQALAADGNYVPAINNLGVAYEKQGRTAQAKEMYEKALAIDPSYDKAKENLERLKKAGGGG